MAGQARDRPKTEQDRPRQPKDRPTNQSLPHAELKPKKGLPRVTLVLSRALGEQTDLASQLQNSRWMRGSLGFLGEGGPHRPMALICKALKKLVCGASDLV